jgi:threonine aldolase
MRQAGIIAAGGVYALRHHVDRLADDHANARLLADGLASIPGIRLVFGLPDTNIVFFDISDTGLTPTQLEAGINHLGVRIGAAYDGTTVIRAVTHLDVSRADCEAAVAAIRQVVTERAPVAVA